jgi:hypothetical protein
MRFYSGPTVLIVDELGYLPMPADDAVGFPRNRGGLLIAGRASQLLAPWRQRTWLGCSGVI